MPDPSDSWRIDRARVRCCLPRGVAFLASWITPSPVQILLPWVKSTLPGQSPNVSSRSPKSLEVILLPQVHSAEGRARQAVQGHRSRAENKAFPAAWGVSCPALHDHCPAPALPGAAVSPHRDAGPAAHLSPSTGQEPPGTPRWAKTHHKLAAVVCDCVWEVYACVCACKHVCCPASLHLLHGPPSTLRLKTLPRIVYFGESLGCKSV